MLFRSASVSSIYPVVGMMSGGTLVTVQGSGFVEGVDVYCKFGGMPSLARWVSSTKLECYSPAASAGYVSARSSIPSSASSSMSSDGGSGYVSLEVSMNDQNYSDDNTLFEYQVGAHVEHIIPNKGAVEGGSLVVVSGSDFSERSASLSYILCRFNLTMVPAVYVSTSVLHCVTPEHPSVVVSVEDRKSVV